MRRLLNALPAAALVTLVFTTPAYANLADWLDKLGELSGPGPFDHKLGGAIELFCWEGQWWEDPARDRPLASSSRVTEAEVIRALGMDEADNPFVLSRLAAEEPSRMTAALSALVQADSAGTRALLKQRARQRFWELRERVMAAGNRDAQMAALRAALVNFNIQNLSSDSAEFQQWTALTASLTVAANFGCTGDLRKPRASVGVYSAWFVTDEVPATYVYSPETLDLDPRVNAIPLAGTFKTTVPGVSERFRTFLRTYEVGLSAGVLILKGPRFDTFTLGYLEAPRVMFRPVAMIACELSNNGCPGHWTKWDAFEIELLWKHIGGFEAKKFGAISGPTSDADHQWSFRAGVAIKFNRDQMPTTLVP